MSRLVSVYARLRQRQFTRHLSISLVKRISKLVGFLIGLIVIHTSGMMIFESMAFKDAIWLSFTTVTTVGYGDFSPSTWAGRLLTILVMYIFAISVLSMLVAEIVEWSVYRMEKKRTGFWEWKKMGPHIQIINTPNHDTERYLKRMVTHIQATPEFQGLPVQILTRKFPDGLPRALMALKILHRTGRAEEGEVLQSINLETARYIILLARDSGDTMSDSITFDVLTRIKGQLGSSACVIAEAVSDDNRARFLQSGADVVIRPVRAYPEMIVRFMAHPGTERVLENLFEYDDDFLCRVDYKFKNISWGDIVCHCVRGGAGTPLAYVKNGEVDTNPHPDTMCSGDGIITLVNQQQAVNPSVIHRCMQSITQKNIEI